MASSQKGYSCMRNKSLQIEKPLLSKEWHSTKNDPLTPLAVTTGSGKKVWWLCEKGHEWIAKVGHRANGSRCPYCAGQKVCTDNCLQTIHPELAKQWHPTKNDYLTPNNVTARSNRKVYWRCSKGHEWIARIYSRFKGTGCPYCSGNFVIEENSLKSINPILAKEWHPNRNESLTPKDVAPNSHMKVWWQCKREHEWEAIIADRNRGNGCPYCNSQTSQLELRVYAELKNLFKNVKHRAKVYGVECDVYIPSLKVGIEIDGFYWHKDKHEADKQKTNLLRSNGILLIRVRENGLILLSENDVSFSERDNDYLILQRILNKVLEVTRIPNGLKNNIDKYLQTGKLSNDGEYLHLLEMLPSPLPGRSLQDFNPQLSREWHLTKNGSLTPSDVHAKSGKKIWWLCNKEHEYDAIVAHRSKGSGCPYCDGKAVCKDNSLKSLNPNLAKQWHPIKNDILTPDHVTVSSHKSAWWRCNKGHEWKASIAGRNMGNGCPYCSGKAVCEDNCLQTVNPGIAREWHPTKNDPLTPHDVTSNSSKKVWWVCHKGHEWQSTITNRSALGRGCPYCTGQAVCNDNCLQTANPKLAKEWHPAKNNELTPIHVTAGCRKKVWWLCSRGHEWEAVIGSRNQGRGCPYCAGKAVGSDNCLQAINPKLAKQWHPANNDTLTPHDVMPNSSKKAWWLCSKGHEWEAVVASRNSGRGCPVCAGQAVCGDNCLQTTNPKLAKEWHPIKNNKLTPIHVTAGCTKKIWWLCSRGHEWEAIIGSRNEGRGCPYCAGKAVCEENCLQTVNPIMAKEWHPTKNDTLTPRDVTCNSGKTAWWICIKGHVWPARIAYRNQGTDCPHCTKIQEKQYGKKV